jgi:hypothetical protein
MSNLRNSKNNELSKNSISALGLNIASYYKLGATFDSDPQKKLPKSSVIIDIQFLGQQELPMMAKVITAELKMNQLYLDNNLDNLKKIFGMEAGSYKSRLFIDPLKLDLLYDPYDPERVFEPIIAGLAIKSNRNLTINVYKTKSEIKLVKVLTGNNSNVDEKNMTDYCVIDKNKSYVILLANPTKQLEYQKTILYDASSNKGREFNLSKIDDATTKVINNIREANQSSKTVLTEDIVLDLLKEMILSKY